MKLASVFHWAQHHEDRNDDETIRGLPPPSSAPAAVGVLSGMAAGAVAGAIAGPPGLIAGALIGSAVGAAASMALDAQSADDQLRNDELDRTIGVIDGDLGAAPKGRYIPSRGLYSAAAMGVSTGAGIDPYEGPIPGAEPE